MKDKKESKTSDFDVFIILIILMAAPIFFICGAIIVSLDKGNMFLGLLLIISSLVKFMIAADLINQYIKKIWLVK